MAYTITLIPGDGIGPEVSAAAKRVIAATGVQVEWEEVTAGQAALERYADPLPEVVIESITRNRVALKGPLTTQVGKGFRSINVALRRRFDLYANIRPARTFTGVPTRYEGVDLIVFRENTEDLYAGIESMEDEDTAKSIKIISRKASERIARLAFEYAVLNNRKKVTAVHKANIMKLSDGLFLESARNVAKEYLGVQFEDVIVDALCMKLVMNPSHFDVLVLPNLYGDIVSDLCAGLVGGLGLAPAANIGSNYAIFEAVHGSAPDIAGTGRANPIALILSAALMLRHIGEKAAALSIEKAVETLLLQAASDKTKVTPDLGGTARTGEVADYIIEIINRAQ